MYKIWNYFYYHWFCFNRHTCSIFMKLSCFKTKYRVKFTQVTLLPQSCGDKCTTLFSRWYTYEPAEHFFWKSDSSTTYSCYNLAKNQLPNTSFVKLTIFSKKGLSNLIQASMINKIYRFLTLYIPLVFKHLINSWPLNISSIFLHIYIYST